MAWGVSFLVPLNVLCASCTWTATSFPRFGEFTSIILCCKLCSMPLTLNSCPYSISIIPWFLSLHGIWKFLRIAFMSFLLNHFLWSNDPTPLLCSQALIFYLQPDPFCWGSFSLTFYLTKWDFSFPTLLHFGFSPAFLSLLNSVFISWMVLTISFNCLCFLGIHSHVCSCPL